MSLILNNYIFCPVDFYFQYPSKCGEDYKKTHDPDNITIKGIAFDSSRNPIYCRIWTAFADFKLPKDKVTEMLSSHATIKGSGIIEYKNYEKYLSLSSYTFSEPCDFSDLVDFDD